MLNNKSTRGPGNSPHVIRFGCCGSMIAPSADPTGAEIIEWLAEIGFDYIELSLRDLMSLSESELALLAGRLERSGIRCEACNNFFPPQIRLTGQDADLTEALSYAGKALDRAARLGAGIVVFGSSASRNVPDGFPMEKAWQQLVEVLGNLGPMAKPHGITITIEPLNKLESNIINLAREGLRLAQEVDHPNIQLLLDFYHLMMERETPEIILQAGSFIRHVHLAKPEGRLFPTEPEDELCRFFSYLERIRYSRRCSIEAYTSGFEADARRSLRILKEMTERPPAWLH
jgi:D-psicose/D-tagatose/L-ribulose 3-epimerase